MIITLFEKNASLIKINENNYIGILYIPDLNNLQMPIIDNWTYSNLNNSSCRYWGSTENNNLVIAGHNYKSGFGKLFNLKEGCIAYLKTINGIIYKYKLDKIEILEPNSVKEMVKSKYDLTLFTCTYGGRTRYTLRFLSV